MALALPPPPPPVGLVSKILVAQQLLAFECHSAGPGTGSGALEAAAPTPALRWQLAVTLEWAQQNHLREASGVDQIQWTEELAVRLQECFSV